MAVAATATAGKQPQARPRELRRGEEPPTAGAGANAAAGIGLLQSALLQLIADRFANGRAAAEAESGGERAQFQMEAYDFLKVPR